MRAVAFLISFLVTIGYGLAQCLSTQTKVIVDITPDNYPLETTWEIRDVAANTLVASGSYNSDTVCLPPSCYRFTIYDQVGDGICCGFGSGSYTLFVDGIPARSGGNFGYFESTSFGCPPVIHDLPLVVINTNGQFISDEPGIIAEMGVIDNASGMNEKDDPFTDYDGHVNIEVRGQSSQSFPKKNYGFETTDAAGVDIDYPLLGFPAEEDWVLHGPYSDKSLSRNVLAMHIANKMGYYASRTKFCEVYINDEYMGVYVLMEKIKRDLNRVDIAKLTPLETSGDDLTGGYIFRIDKGNDPGWLSSYDVASQPGTPIQFKYVYPKGVDIVTEQENYIKAYVDSFEYALASPNWHYGGKRYDELIDVVSFADNYIINELAKNVDAYRISTYFHKDKDSNGGKVKAMPVWDYNLGFSNADYCYGASYTGWMYDIHCDNGNPFWLARMRQDTLFRDVLKCRWDKWRSEFLNMTYLNTFLDSVETVLVNAQQRNFTAWPVLGVYVWPNPAPYANTHQEELTRIKSFLTNRITWMDGQITGSPDCDLYFPPPPPDGTPMLTGAAPLHVYPMPFSETVTISGVSMASLEVINAFGQCVERKEGLEQSQVVLSTQQWPAGMYVVRVTDRAGAVHVAPLIKR